MYSERERNERRGMAFEYGSAGTDSTGVSLNANIEWLNVNDWIYPMEAAMEADEMREHDIRVMRAEYAMLHMEVCAENGATDAEILGECNLQNESDSPWDEVIRESRYGVFSPWECDGDHTHFYVSRKQ